jgi:hypothetical protein
MYACIHSPRPSAIGPPRRRMLAHRFDRVARRPTTAGVSSAQGWGVVKSLVVRGTGPVRVLHTQKVRYSREKAHFRRGDQPRSPKLPSRCVQMACNHPVTRDGATAGRNQRFNFLSGVRPAEFFPSLASVSGAYASTASTANDGSLFFQNAAPLLDLRRLRRLRRFVLF